VLIEIKELTKEYKRGATVFQAVNKVNLKVSSKDFVSIIGPSGSGKSTLINMIAGLIVPTSGSIRIDGQNILSMKDKEVSFYRNSKIGYIPQENSLLPNLTVLDNVVLPFFFFKRKGNITERAYKLLKQVGIPHLAHSYPDELSGGERRRISIARALINNPDFLFADEPASDLDSQTTKDIMALFGQLSQRGIGILMVTHEADCLQYCNTIYEMNAGILTRNKGKQ
jgi:ABC-type lipoprotein export system ATPase subunit